MYKNRTFQQSHLGHMREYSRSEQRSSAIGFSAVLRGGGGGGLGGGGESLVVYELHSVEQGIWFQLIAPFHAYALYKHVKRASFDSSEGNSDLSTRSN